MINDKNNSRIISNLKDDKYSYHSSVSSKISEKEEKNPINKRINLFKNLNFKFRKPSNEKEKFNISSSLRNKFKSSVNLPIKKTGSKNEKEKEKEIGYRIKEEKIIKKKVAKRILKPVVINELPNDKYFSENKNKKIKNKIIKIYIFHREEVFLIEIYDGLTVNDLIEQIRQNIKIIKNELEVFLIYDNIKNNLQKKNLQYFLKNLLIKTPDNKYKFAKNNMKYISDKTDANNSKQKLLIFPDHENKYTKLKIKELLRGKNNYFIKANQVSKNKYYSNYKYKKGIKNISINSFVDNVNKEIEKNNIILSDNNIKAVNIENTCKKDNNKGIKNKYKNIVIVEGINDISEFLKEIESFLNEHDINDNYDCQNIGIGKYSFGFQRQDISYDFNKFISLLKLVKKDLFHIKNRLKMSNSKRHLKNSFDNNSSIKEKKMFFYSNKFNHNDYFALKNNLNGSSNSYFLIKGKKKYLPKEDTESMDEIVAMNRYKFKFQGGNINYINSDNFQSIPLI
jgi:hypothetical protein